MATNAKAGAAKQLASARLATSYYKKYSLRTPPFWDRLRRLLAIDPNRSTGIPLNPQYRNPPPGVPAAEAYEDPITLPAGDIAENPYYKRDARRMYPKTSVVRQADVVGLLSVGSVAKPKELASGEAGMKQLVEVRKEGEQMGVAGFLAREKGAVRGLLGEGGMPVWPAAVGREKAYVMGQDREEGYPEE
ncbi:hypothetical protein MMC30_003268 [Trapelia coarctata]|nr:hypothetical protein [Trapelia coarctata]